MWIETTNTDSAGEPVTRRLRKPGTDDEFVAFSENGKAQVTSDVGEQLVEQHDSVVPVEAASSDEDSGEADDPTDGSDDN